MNKSGNPDFTNNNLTHPEETLNKETLQSTAHSGHNSRDRGQTKTQTELTCAMPQVEHILNMF